MQCPLPKPCDHFIVAARPQTKLRLNLYVQLVQVPNYGFLPLAVEAEVDTEFSGPTYLCVAGPIVEIHEMRGGHVVIRVENLFKVPDLEQVFLLVMRESGIPVDKDIGRALASRLDALLYKASNGGRKVHTFSRRRSDQKLYEDTEHDKLIPELLDTFPML